MIPAWAYVAAEELYAKIDQITAEAMQQGQIEQDAMAEWHTFRAEVARIIADAYSRHERPRVHR